MSLVSYTREGEAWTGHWENGGKRSYTVAYLVTMSSKEDGPAQVMASVGVALATPYHMGNDGDFNTVAKSVTAKRKDGDAPVWRVTITYGERDPFRDEPNPLDRPWKVSYGHASYTKAVTRDRGGRAIQNTAGDPFDPPIEVEYSRPVITVTRNESSFNAKLAEEYDHAINKDAWSGYKKETVLFFGMTGNGPQFENGIRFWEVGYEFHVNSDGWGVQILNQGMRQKNSDGEVVQILVKDVSGTDEGQEFISQPTPLDKDGAVIVNPTPDNKKLYFFEDKPFQVYDKKSFARLNLDLRS